MLWFEYVITSIFSSLTLLFTCMSYSKISNANKLKINFKTVFALLIFGILITINTKYNIGYSRALIGYLITIINCYVIFSDDFNLTIIKGTFCYLLSFVFEIILYVVLIATKMLSLEIIDKNLIVKILFSIVTVALPYGILSIKRVNKTIKKFIDNLNRPVITSIVFIFCLLFIAMISYKAINNLSTKKYVDSVFLLMFFIFLVYLIIYNKYMVVKEVNKTEELLDMMTIYEKRIDEDRIIRHEMLNNLLTLKSFKDKNSEEFDKTLDDFIMTCSNKSVGVKNIYKLPSGLKGIVYYKMNIAGEKKINYSVNISKQVNIKLEKESYKEYVSLCKILGIIIDNAIEASEKTKDKLLIIDAYNEKDGIVIEVTNSCKEKDIDVSSLYRKGYSSKGNNRGFGLYIARMLLKNSKHLKMEQVCVNNLFTTKIIIK